MTFFYDVDRGDATSTFVAASTEDCSSHAFDASGALVATRGHGLITVDLTSGEHTNMGSGTGPYKAVAFWSSSTAVSTPEIAPTAYTLIPAAPNPFNPRTRIGFTLPKAGRARIDVFDAQGRLVTTLTDGVFPAGRHDVVFQADRWGSGIYFYRVELPELRETRKMTLLK